MNNKAEWAVLYQGVIDNEWQEGITEADLFLDDAQYLADKLNDSTTDLQFWVVHESSNSYQQHL